MSRCVRPNGKPMEQRGPIQPMSKEDELFWKLRRQQPAEPKGFWRKIMGRG